MRCKYQAVAILLIGCLIGSIPSISYAGDKFYYGTWTYKAIIPDYPVFRDSLYFNLVFADLYSQPSEHVDSLAKYGIRAVGFTWQGDSTTPVHWTLYSYYSVWEAEGYLGSAFNLVYFGGTEVNDGEASGGKARYFSSSNADSGLIQRGPNYWQEATIEGMTINYLAEFRLKLVGSFPDTTKICQLILCDSLRVRVLAETTLVWKDFVTDQYKIFPVPYTRPDFGKIEFQILWFGFGELYIDYVKVSNEKGRQLMSGAHDADIMSYVSQPWVSKIIPSTGETVVYGWYERDEPCCIDHYWPYAHVDSVLSQVSQERLGNQALWIWWDSVQVREYVLRSNPKELHMDPYPVGQFGNNYSGPAFQNGVTTLTGWLNMARTQANNFGKDLWLTIQAWTSGDTTSQPGNCQYPLFYNGRWYCLGGREPTPLELRLQTYLAICYGANAIMNWMYFYAEYPGLLITGLYDQYNDSTTAKWREIRDFTGPRMKVLGPTYGPLEWQGACLDNVVISFVLRNSQPSYIDSIRSPGHEPHWVQVGFFENTTADTSYFMLVNRECLATEGADYDVFVTKTGGPYQIRDMYTDSIVGNVNGIGDYFIVYLGPGEGKLFRLEEIYPGERIRHIPADYPTIQEAINAAINGDTVLVAPGTYYENINFIGKAITVASHFIFDRNPPTIEATIIDGRYPYNVDSASVVRFVSGEGSNSILKGFTITGGTGTSQWGPGRALHQGGGIYCYYSSPTIVNNVIIENHIPDHGGGLHWEMGGGIGCCWETSSPLIANNLILNNSCDDGGGGISLYNAGSPIIVNNTLLVNNPDGIHGNLYFSCIVTNNIVANNTNFGIWGSYYGYDISYNDVWNNPDGNFVLCPPEIGDTTWGTNVNGTPCDTFRNIIRDPMFVAPDTDFHLQESSPCINAGDNDAPGLPDFDFDSNPRIRGWYVDMGAYESEYVTFICGDVNADGSVPNLGDVVYLISYVYKGGPPPPPPISRADVNSSGGLPNLGDVVYLIAYVYKGGPAPFCTGINGP